MNAAQLRERLDRYHALTQKDYLTWYSENVYIDKFPLLVKTGIIDLWTAFQSCLSEDGAISKPRLLQHIRFDSIDALKAGLLEMDQDWHTLADAMELNLDFRNRYQEDIIIFLCRDVDGIAQTYLDCLNQKLHPAFHRVVKAELMGQFYDLKYHGGDLEQELDYPLGTQPDSTCLSYRNGAYCRCLPACFDSNNKVLYAEMNGEIIGRAFTSKYGDYVLWDDDIPIPFEEFLRKAAGIQRRPVREGCF